MKKIFYALILGIIFFQFAVNTHTVVAQTTPASAVKDIFCEDFDTTANLWGMTRSNSNINRNDSFKLERTVTKEGSWGAAKDTIANSNTSYLTSPLIDIKGFSSVGIQFDHIAYIDQFDDATVQYSFDKGVTWNRLPKILNDNGIIRKVYTGPSVYDFFGNFKFEKRSQPSRWKFQPTPVDTFEFKANSTAWITENFDLTYLLLRNPTVVDSLQIRFGLFDEASRIGRTGTHTWFIDNFCIRGADCELVPPTIDLLNPPRDYVQRYEGRVYQSPPYIFDAKMLDNTGIDTGLIVYQHLRDTTLMGGADKWKLLSADTIPMVRFPGNNFEGEIPQIFGEGTLNDTINGGDSIYWKVVTIDKSDCKNSIQDPPDGFSKFLVVGDLPKSCNTQPIFEYPYYEPFDDASRFIPGRPGIFIQTGWQNVQGDFHNWWSNLGPTMTPGTGPSAGFPASPPNQFLYVESTNFKDSTAYLLSPCFDFSSDLLTNGLIRFYVNMNTSSLEDTLWVDIFDPIPKPGFQFGKFQTNVIPPVTGFKGDRWVAYEISTFPFRNRVTQLRFRAKPGNNSTFGDMAIDSFKIVPAPLVDLRLNPVDLAPYSPRRVDDKVVINVQNLGTTDATSIEFNYEIIGDKTLNIPTIAKQTGDEGWTGVLKPGETQTIILPTLEYEVPLGEYELKAWLTYTGDESNTNDTSFSRSIGLENFKNGKYMDNFDGRNLWTTFADENTLLANKWELGTPNFDATNSAITQPNAWDILLNRPYTGTGVTISLLSPFIDMSNSDSTIMSFLNNRDIEETEDGVFIEYSLDRGLNWDRIVAVFDPLQKNWYNSFLQDAGLGGTPVLASRTNCWAKTWNGWLESEVLLPELFDGKKEVLFRFNFFAANDDDGNDGLSMDNFLVYDPTNIDLEPQFNLYPNSACDLTRDMRINTIIKNRGLDDISIFDVEYIIKTPSGNTITKTDSYDKLITTRDTGHVWSKSTFDMFETGDYLLKIVTKIPGDGCIENDTLTKLVENIEGCSLRFVITNSSRKINNQLPCDSSSWRFTYISGDRTYEVAGAYNDDKYPIGYDPGETINDLDVCIKTNSKVRLNLNDRDSLIDKYSLIAFNGGTDTTILEDVAGGRESPTQFFDWVCPLDRDPTAVRILLDRISDKDSVQLPTSKEYVVDVEVLNRGLDSLDNVQVAFQIDQQPAVVNNYAFTIPLKYNRRTTVTFGKQFIPPGEHILRAWTQLPNGQNDQDRSNDTTERFISLMDTVNTDSTSLAEIGGDNLPSDVRDTLPDTTYIGYCDNFDEDNPLWIPITVNAYRQNITSFEQGNPTTPRINGAASGSNAWATVLDGDYPEIDTSTLLSPFFWLKNDACYELSFRHNFFIRDSLNDGAQIQMTTNKGLSWITLGDGLGDTNSYGQANWYNRQAITSFPPAKKVDTTYRIDTLRNPTRVVKSVVRIDSNYVFDYNGGWSGDSRGWKLARTTINPDTLFNDQYVAFRFRFQSDGSIESDGWAIDDFCLGEINYLNCFGVGLRESSSFDNSKLFLGQNIPNPASYNTTIPYFLPKSGQVNFVVVNLLGQPVYEERGNKPYGEGLFNLDISDLSKGVYYYWLTFEGERLTNKMIIVK